MSPQLKENARLRLIVHNDSHTAICESYLDELIKY